MKTTDSDKLYTGIVGILELTARDRVGRKVALNRFKRGLQRGWRVDTAGLRGPLKLSVTLRAVN